MIPGNEITKEFSACNCLIPKCQSFCCSGINEVLKNKLKPYKTTITESKCKK